MATDWKAELRDFFNDIKDEGFSLVVEFPGSPGVFNPDTLEYEGAVEATTFATYGIKDGFKAHEIDGTIVQSADVKIYIPGLDLPAEITTETKIIVEDTKYSVISVEKIDPANITVGYIVHARK